jgi:hypothetical protein
MKKGITIGLALVFAVMVGGLSMGCIDSTIEDAFIPEVVEVVEVVVVPEEVESTTIVVEIVIVEVEEVEVITYKLTYNPCITVLYPDNVAGFDTIEERANELQGRLDAKISSIGTNTAGQYHIANPKAYSEFYQEYYQDELDGYIKMYCTLGNKILTDDNEPIVRSIGAFNFTSPWGKRSLGNGSFVYDTYEGKVSFVGSEEIASGGAVFVTEEGAIISNMYYTYMGNNATLPGNTGVTF